MTVAAPRLHQKSHLDPVAAEAAPRVWYRASDGTTSRDGSPEALRAIVSSGEGTLWVDLDVRDRKQFALLEQVFSFHPLSIEDVTNPATRVKIEEFATHLFAIIRGVRFCEETPDDPYDVETYNLYFFLGKNFLVTAHSELSPSLDAVHERLERSPDLLARGVGRLMHATMDATVDAFFPVIDQLDTFVDSLEERVFAQFDQNAMRDIFSVKRLVLSLRRHLTPQREVFNVLSNRPSPLLPADMQIYYRDIYDHVLRITDSLDSFRDLLGSTMESYLSQVNNRLGTATKALSVVATFTLPFVVISGMWGMNFDVIPLAHDARGFLILVLFQALLGLTILAALRRKGIL